MSKIDEFVIIKWNNRSVVVRVLESEGQWKPSFDIGTTNGTSVADSDTESMSESESVDMEEFEEEEIRNDRDEEDGQNRSDEGPTPVVQHEELQTQAMVELDNLRPVSKSSGNKCLVGNEKSPASLGYDEAQEPPSINVSLNSHHVHGGMEEGVRFPTSNRKVDFQ
ncbi:hypothetical protein Hanom_Chr09g00832451 [Helianthus anomalus]